MTISFNRICTAFSALSSVRFARGSPRCVSSGVVVFSAFFGSASHAARGGRCGVSGWAATFRSSSTPDALPLLGFRHLGGPSESALLDHHDRVVAAGGAVGAGGCAVGGLDLALGVGGSDGEL